MAAIIPSLKVNKNAKPFVLGKDMLDYFYEIYSFIRSTRNPSYFIGDPGTGKSHMLKQIILQYARDTGCKAYLTQVDDETMRNTLLGGFTFENGSKVPFLSILGDAMKYGHIVGIDEVTHGMQSVQTSFNTVTDRDSRYSFGVDMVEAHPNFRVVFGSNFTTHAGNSPLVHSFASRLMAWPFDYPCQDTEAEIAKNIAARSIGAENMKCPDGMIYFMTNWTRQIRRDTKNTLCVSARNVAMMIELFSLLPFNTQAKFPREWTQQRTAETVRRAIGKRIFDKDVLSNADLTDEMIDEVQRTFVGIGIDRTKKGMCQAAMYYLPIDGISKQEMDGHRQVMLQSIM